MKMKIFKDEALASEHIDDYTKRLVYSWNRRAKVTKRKDFILEGLFNGVVFQVNEHSTEDSLKMFIWKTLHERDDNN